MLNRLLDIEAVSQRAQRVAHGEAPVSADEIQKFRRTAEDCIARYPAASLGAALAFGVFLGWLIKRR